MYVTSSPSADKVLTSLEEGFIDRLRQSFSGLPPMVNLRLEFRNSQGARAEVIGSPDFLSAGDPKIYRIYEPAESSLLLFLPEGDNAIRSLVETTVQAVLDRIEVEKREELLLDELGTNWESLEALYEISTDVLRFGDVKNALKRLINRFTSLQEGLQACLYLGRSGRLEPIAASHELPLITDWASLGPVEKPIRESRSLVINDPPPGHIIGGMPWSRATSVAAAPVTSRQQTVIGLLIVWRDDRRFVFDAPFSRFLEAITYQASMLLESDRLNRTMRENERLAQEIEIASSIQQTLLLGNPPSDVPSIEIASFSAASQQIDGDFHDFLKHENTIDVLIGDVMGKGVAAALLGAATKSQFLRAIANLAIQNGGAPSPVEIVQRAAARLGSRLLALERFVTLCYARFDPARGCIEFVDCGHTGILVHRKNTGETFFLRGDDLPLGVRVGDQPQQHTAPLMPGDTFLLFSDGVTETRNVEGELFGEDRLFEGLETWSSLGPDLLLRQIRKLTDGFRGEESQTDDFTCIAVRIGAGPEMAPRSRRQAEFGCDLEHLGTFRDWLHEAAGELDPESLSRLEGAATEAFANCVLHGSAGQCRKAVRLDAIGFENHLKVEIRHEGPPFDAMGVPPPSFDGSRDGGFGTFIIMRSADELAYRREGDTNLISISIIRRQK